MSRTCELYLRLGGDDLPAPERLEDIVRAAMPAAILIGKSLLEKLGNKNRLEALVNLIKRQNLAVLFEDNAALAAKLKADGAHLTGGAADVKEARELLGEDAYIGASSPLSRHEVMVLGEAGASYVAFGADGGTDAARFDALVEMTEWWGGIIELPCAIWLDADADETQMRTLIEAGADYLAPEMTVETDLDRLAHIAELMKSTG
ncbi:MAG TPA: thiamine phosphate synthase [Hyphomicrobiales bacterium]|nr:thiamine phosphate synthase [Hyphomicrobiales bacterium]